MKSQVLAVTAAARGSLDGNEITVRDPLTGLVTSFFVPEKFHYRDRSKYMPHQGKAECLRRSNRLMKEYAIG